MASACKSLPRQSSGIFGSSIYDLLARDYDIVLGLIKLRYFSQMVCGAIGRHGQTVMSIRPERSASEIAAALHQSMVATSALGHPMTKYIASLFAKVALYLTSQARVLVVLTKREILESL